MPVWSGSGWLHCPWLQRAVFLCSHVMESGSSGLLQTGTNPFMRSPASWPNHLTKPHLLKNITLSLALSPGPETCTTYSNQATAQFHLINVTTGQHSENTLAWPLFFHSSETAGKLVFVNLRNGARFQKQWFPPWKLDSCNLTLARKTHRFIFLFFTITTFSNIWVFWNSLCATS